MFELIGNIFKICLFSVVVIVLSHVIEIQGTTVSSHVLHAMHWVTGYSPKAQADRMTASINHSLQARVDQLNKIDQTDAEMNKADQAALNKVIENSQFKKR